MPKKRKTRKQKISIEQKRQVVHETPPSLHTTQTTTELTKQETAMPSTTFSLPTNYHQTQTVRKEKKPSVEEAVISTNEYGYLSKDLLRTAVLSSAIVIAELLIRIFFRG